MSGQIGTMTKRLTNSLVAAAMVLATAGAATASERPPQLILVSFDGAHDNALWDRARRIGAETGARFTFFLSCTFLMSRSDRAAYQGPHQKRGYSATGFAQSDREVQIRLNHVWQAHLAGHEMASHACGHFDGADWTKADWAAEFAAFDRTLLNAWKHAGYGGLEPGGWADFVSNDIRGFRAPYLSTGPGLTAALKGHGFRYDASLVTKGPAWPDRNAGLPRFGLPLIPEGPAGKRVIAMDYNLFMRHSRAEETPEKRAEFADRTLAAFRAAFHAQYEGERVPLQLGFHFVAMNGGAYWDALETFLKETCAKPDVACVTYSDALERTGTEKADNSAF